MAYSRRSGCGVWLLFWVIIFLTLLIIILLNKEEFNNFSKKYIKPEKDKSEIKLKRESELEKEKQLKTEKETKKDSKINYQISNKFLKNVQPSNNVSEFNQYKIKKEMKVLLYFVRYLEKEDRLKLVPVERTIEQSDTPLKDTINLLLKGPTPAEEMQNIISVFPANVKLLSAEVKNGIAYLNFNSNIEIGVGVSTMMARLYQIVYTATQFESVKGVQILIDGKYKESFSVEGISIKYPLKRLNTAPIF